MPTFRDKLQGSNSPRRTQISFTPRQKPEKTQVLFGLTFEGKRRSNVISEWPTGNGELITEGKFVPVHAMKAL
jgi:hypothetical protein